MEIVLLHKEYDKKHLDEVIANMKKMGAPTIKAYYDEAEGIYFATEGCHRIRAAKKLGIMPVIDIIDWEEEIENKDTGDILTSEWLFNNYSYTTTIDFDDFE